VAFYYPAMARATTEKTVPELGLQSEYGTAMQLDGYWRDIARSIGFLSRLPVAAHFYEDDDLRISRFVRGFPLAGAVILVPVGLLYALLSAIGATPLMAAFAALTVQTVLTGALHEDGLSDTADGLGGGRDREHALAIMKDSRIGTYGAAALILSFGLRAAALAALLESLPPITAALCLPAAAAISRALLVWHWSALPPARQDGVAAGAGQPERAALRMALLSGLLIAVVLVLPGLGLWALLSALALSVLAVAAFTRWVRQKIGGHTGDTIGAAQQICEAVVLCTLAIAA